MCVIIVNKEGELIKDEVLLVSAKINPHGLGVLWLDDYKVTYHESDDYGILQTERPFVAHFRYATVGKVSKENTHPFHIDDDHVLFQNGTVNGLGNSKMTDTEHLAQLLSRIPKSDWRSVLEMTDCRFVIGDLKNRKVKIYNREMWSKRGEVLYSKNNVLDKTLLAVYGTLRYGNGNFRRYLSYDSYMESGVTANKYPMLDRGIPYVLPQKGVGHKIVVDVMAVSKTQLHSIDQLEGHPTWYKRERTEIELDDGNTVTAWLYFNDTVVPTPGEEFKADFGGMKPYKPGAYMTSYDPWEDDYYNKDSGVYIKYNPTTRSNEIAFEDPNDFEEHQGSFEECCHEYCPKCGETTVFDDTSDLTWCENCGDYTINIEEEIEFMSDEPIKLSGPKEE